jgi:hypothetical protein
MVRLNSRLHSGQFFMMQGKKLIEMVRLQNSRISLVTLILCLCLGSMIVPPMTNMVNLALAEGYGIEFERNNQNDQTILDEEFLIAIVHGLPIDCQLSSKFNPLTLRNPPSNLTPESPPPECS